ncbi:MAG: Gfo/Idh/MocA family oxidoreductase [Lentisphaeria bacterium]|nr:Gfo/Idh/MocA family oxidoreductase [Lentisphaerota bacterium]MBR7145798.1 Gfo/Idh/MocA family oxidoreductase [Lentisphaeria bacterium]
MGKVITVAIAGQGRSGWGIHTKYLRTNSNFKIVAVADELPERRQQAIDELGCEAYCNYQELLDKGPAVDLFVNATPSAFHVETSMAAMKSGKIKYLVTEKPTATTVEEFDMLVETAKETGVLLYPFQNSRFYPMFTKIREILASGVLGKIVYIRSNWSGFGRRWDWQTRQDQKAGNLFNTGPHPVDQAVVLFGEEYPTVNAVFASEHWDLGGDAENMALVRLTGPNNPTIDIDISSLQAYKIGNMYNISGTYGGLIADANKIQWKYFNPEEAPKQEFWKPWSKDRQYCGEQLKWTEMTWECANANSNATGFSEIVHLLYKDFYAVVTEGKAPEITHDQVRRQVYIMEEAHKQNPLPKKPLK